MDEFCQNPLCENKAGKEVPVSVETPDDQAISLCAACEEVYTWGVQHGGRIDYGLRIDPPGEEKSPEPLYSVVYIIDVNAANVHEAAAGRRKEDSVLIVTDRGTVVHVRAYGAKTATEKGLFEYLRKCQDYDGREDMGAVSEWIEEHGEHLSVDIVQQDIRGETG